MYRSLAIMDGRNAGSVGGYLYRIGLFCVLVPDYSVVFTGLTPLRGSL